MKIVRLFAMDRAHERMKDSDFVEDDVQYFVNRAYPIAYLPQPAFSLKSWCI